MTKYYWAYERAGKLMVSGERDTLRKAQNSARKAAKGHGYLGEIYYRIDAPTYESGFCEALVDGKWKKIGIEWLKTRKLA